MTVQSDIQKFNPGDLVTLYELDTTQYDGTIHRFCSSVDNGSSVMFGGTEYPPYPVEAKGFQLNSSGTLPQPTLVIGDKDGAFYGLIKQNNDLLGSKLTRIRTLSKHLDTGATPDSSARFPDDVYFVERKVNQNRYYTELSLNALLDMQGKKLPGRIILKNICTHIYRVYNGSSFDYTKATCPYTDTNYFDSLGVSTTIDLDVCGKRLSDCQKRFPQPLSLPTRAFPGVYNVRN